MTRLERLVQFYAAADWDATCRWAERNLPELERHMDTWGSHCGAPRDVYLGHIVRMLVDLASDEGV